MRQPEQHTPFEIWVDERVELYLDDELPPEDAEQFARALATGIGGDDLALARRIRGGLRALPQPMCRPQVSESILAHARADRRRLLRHHMDAWLRRWWGEALRPALAMVVLLAVVVSAALVGRPAKEPSVSQAEIQQALAEAKWALAVVSEAGRQTAASVRKDVIAPHVVRPIQQALGTVLEEQ